MSYDVYKSLHLISLIIVTSCLGISFFSTVPKKWVKILGSIASLLIFVGGMGLIARIGVSHGQPWPLWIKAKVGIWLVIATLSPILAKRVKNYRPQAFFALLVLFVAAILVAIIKPGA